LEACLRLECLFTRVSLTNFQLLTDMYAVLGLGDRHSVVLPRCRWLYFSQLTVRF